MPMINNNQYTEKLNKSMPLSEWEMEVEVRQVLGL